MKNFSELELIAPLQRALNDEGYEKPTPIQAKTLPSAIDGQDVLGVAQTGTGKTAAFALPILNWLGSEPQKAITKRPSALILAPTRELAIQIGESLTTYGRHLRLRSTTIFGGVGQGKQVNQLKRGVHILVATPGRLLDLMNQGHLHLDSLEIFVLDEADRMLDMGFLPDLKRIVSKLPKDRQSLFFSATLPPSIKSLAKKLLYDPVNVNIAPKSVSVEKIDQRVMLVAKGEKQRLLKHILAEPGMDSAIVFTRTKRGANRLSETLAKGGFRTAAIHGNKSQSARQKALAAFREKKVQVLVATDVAARGIDIEGVSHVVNFDLPREPESYVHRIGRTGRAGADGIAVSFCLPDEKRELRAIEKLIGKSVPIVQKPALPERTESDRRQGGSHNSSPKRNRRRGPKKRGKKKPADGKAAGSRKPAAKKKSASGETTAKKKKTGKKKAAGKKASNKKPAGKKNPGNKPSGNTQGKRRRKRKSAKPGPKTR